MSNDVHALSGAYAVDALDESERAVFERHLAECAACRAEVDDLREAAAELAGLTAVTPPPSLRERVLAEVATTRPLPPVVTPLRRRTPLRSWLPGVLVAAALVLVVAVAWRPWADRVSEGEGLPVAVARIAEAPDSQSVRHTLADGSTLTVYRSVSLNRAAVVASGLPMLRSDQDYELWLQDESGAMRAAGLLPDEPSDTTLVLRGPAGRAQAVGLTVEPAGGSTAPTSDPLAVVALS